MQKTKVVVVKESLEMLISNKTKVFKNTLESKNLSKRAG
jgi:hypothetical protein